MACTREREEAIADLVGGKLGSEAALELLDHLEGCTVCSEDFDLFSELVAEGSGRDLYAAPGRVLLMSRMRRVVAVAAGLVALVALVALLGRGGRPTLQDLAAIEPLPAAGSELRGGTPERGSFWSEAMQRYAAGDHEGVVRALEGPGKERTDDALLQLYLGMSLLAVKSPERALAALEHAARHGEGLVAQNAEWYAAHAELALARGAAAEARLRRLIDEETDYALNARELLERIGSIDR